MTPPSLGAVRRAVRRVSSPLLSLVFPESCWVSGEAISSGQLGLGDEARQKLAHSVLWPYCARCGATLGHGARVAWDMEKPCGECARRELNVQKIVRVGTFEEPLAELVHAMKFGKRWELGRVVAPFLYQAMARGTGEGKWVKVELLVPVALHWRRKLTRGFNQSEELAREVGKLGGWPVANVLTRVRATREQSQTQTALQRKENLRGAFACVRPEEVAGKHVWLVDDVCTTGATINAAAMALRRLPKAQRPAGIYAAVLCVTDRVGVPETPIA